MADIIWHSFLAAFAGGLLSLDRTAALQIMISRPIVAAPVVGFVSGDVMTGLFIGMVLELFFISGLPVGGYIPPHEAMMTALITAISISGQKMLSGSGFVLFPWEFGMPLTVLVSGLTILITLPLDVVCKRADRAARVLNIRLFDAASASLERGVIEGVMRNNLKGIGIFFVFNFTTLFILILAGVMLVYALFQILPAVVIMSLPLAWIIVSILSFSSSYNTVYGRKSLSVFLAATFFVLTLLLVTQR